MEKLDYKVKVGKKTETKSVELVDLNWNDYCRTTDLAIQLSLSKSPSFSDIGKLIQIYTGKSDQDMMDWKNSINDNGEFINEMSAVFTAITSHHQKKRS